MCSTFRYQQYLITFRGNDTNYRTDALFRIKAGLRVAYHRFLPSETGGRNVTQALRQLGPRI